MTARPSRTRSIALGAVVAAACLLGPAAWTSASAQETFCSPGSGPDLSNRRVTQDEVARPADLRCADLRGADLSGLDLSQAKLSGAVATGASFVDARLRQASLEGADLSGADLTGAELQQARMSRAVLSGAVLVDAELRQTDLDRAVLVGADLTDADLMQADLRRADLTDADISGANAMQVKLKGAELTGLRGVPRYDTYLAIGAGVILLLLLAASVRRAFKPAAARPAAGLAAGMMLNHRGMPNPAVPTPLVSSAWGASGAVAAPPAPPVQAASPFTVPAGGAQTRRGRGVAYKLLVGVAGSVLTVLGIHLFAGGMIGSFARSFNPFLDAVPGPLHVVGLGSGIIGAIVGPAVVFAGLALRSQD